MCFSYVLRQVYFNRVPIVPIMCSRVVECRHFICIRLTVCHAPQIRMHILVTCQTKRVTHMQDLINVDLMKGTSIGNKLYSRSTDFLEKGGRLGPRALEVQEQLSVELKDAEKVSGEFGYVSRWKVTQDKPH